ncbi:MAG: DnaJ C-terminal domain-containing protein [Syntrophotaleaceae bacterium]
MPNRDYYRTLGVARNAESEEVKRAYRRLSQKYHPDVSLEPDAERRFREVAEAYEVLGDRERRADYDRSQVNVTPGNRIYNNSRPESFYSRQDFPHGGVEELSDLFEGLRRDRFRYPGDSGSWGYRQGEDLHATVQVDLEDSYRGAVRTITLEIPEIDPYGRLRQGKMDLSVRIPKGILPGQQIRLSGYGGPPENQGNYGDLYLEVEFRPHRFYRVDGKDLYLDLPVAPWEAALGGKIKIPTPEGVVDLQIPAGSGTGRILRLKGRGLPAKPPGHLYAVLQVALPPADSPKARELYRRMEQDLPFNPRSSFGI